MKAPNVMLSTTTGESYYLCLGCGEWENDNSGGALYNINVNDPFGEGGYFCKSCADIPRGFLARLKAHYYRWFWLRALDNRMKRRKCN